MDESIRPDSDNDDARADDLESQYSKLADQLAELSTADASPSGFRTQHDPFDAADVDFRSNVWLLRVIQVQAWLNPGSEVDAGRAETAPLAAALDLFAALEAVAPAEHVLDNDGVVALTPSGADYLGARLDTALALQHAFAESLEFLTAKQATAQWIESWEDNVDTPPTTEPIKAKSDVWRISDFAGKASRGLLNLSPSYQRGDVWPTKDAQKLIESILRGIPLPSVILLKPKSKTKRAVYEVVDGKQRMTSILRFIGQHPEALRRVAAAAKQHPALRLAEHFRDDYKTFRRLWKTAMGEALSDRREAEYYFPFRLAQGSRGLQGSLSPLAGKYYYEVRESLIDVGEGQETVQNVFEASSDYKIPLIEYLDASPKQIHEVFHLYNRQGKHLNAEEIRNALFHEVDLVKLVLAASGDNSDVAALAPYFPPDEHHLLRDISVCLNNYKFGTARYRRTKLLSWLYALLFQPSETDGALLVRSTARQIDTLLDTVSSHDGHALVDRAVLVALIRDTGNCLDAHSSSDCWARQFKDDDKGLKWQELQLVASLIGVFLIGVTGADSSALLTRHREALLTFTSVHRRPDKTQNRTQWAFIGEVALGIVAIAGISEIDLEAALMRRFGVSCLPTLRAAQATYKARSAD